MKQNNSEKIIIKPVSTDKIELLRKVDLFSKLREYELDVIAKHSEICMIEKGEPVFVHDDEADAIYVLKSGRIGIISVEAKDMVTIAQISPDESFGELDFFGLSRRSASAFAEEDSVLLRFPAKNENRDKIFSDHAYVSASMLFRLLGILSERIWRVDRLIHDKSGWLIDLHKQLQCDKLTGLYNQNYLKDDYLRYLPDFERSVSMLMIKPDNFKDINDRFGHKVGDQVLAIMAIFLQSELNENDIGIRYHGDEFAAIILDADRAAAVKKAKQISSAFKSMDLSRATGSADGFKILVSIGISFFPDDSDSSSEIVTIAHKKMMRARESGGNRVVV